MNGKSQQHYLGVLTGFPLLVFERVFLKNGEGFFTFGKRGSLLAFEVF
jgi:hypothetical protein